MLRRESTSAAAQVKLVTQLVEPLDAKDGLQGIYLDVQSTAGITEAFAEVAKLINPSKLVVESY